MPVPFRLVHFLGGLGTASTSGIGITGWQAWEEYNPTGDRKLRSRGFVYGPIKFKDDAFKVSQTTEFSNKFFHRSHECFDKFFDVQQFSFEIDKNSSDTLSITPPSSADGSGYMGCTIMQLSHGPKNEGFIFMSETAVKNDRVGMVVWAGAKNVKFANDTGESTGDTYFRYYALFLTKPSDNWLIRGGIIWDDFNVSTGYSDNKIKIISPDQTISQSYDSSPDRSREQPSQDTWTYEKYSGLWMSTVPEESGTNIFGDVRVLSAQTTHNKEYPEILGVSGELGFVEDYSSCAGHAYSTRDNKWKKLDRHYSCRDTLKPWYDQFKDKKGAWINLADHCLIKSGARNLSDEEVRFLERFCYQKNSR